MHEWQWYWRLQRCHMRTTSKVQAGIPKLGAYRTVYAHMCTCTLKVVITLHGTYMN